jgi:butyrate kinase
MSFRILAINPGSTSTKIALYDGRDERFRTNVRHDVAELATYKRIIDQFDFRLNAVMAALAENGIDTKTLSAVVGRGGMLKPIESGTFLVNDLMVDDMKKAERGEHASNLGAVIAKSIADLHGIPAFIVDPVAVDEMEDIARYTGMPEIRRVSLFHALNQKAIARKAAEDLGKPYESLNLVIAHLGGGISVGVHKRGRVVDVNNALDGDGPMSPERSGSVPLGPLYKMVFSGKYTLEEIKRKNYGNGGLAAYLGTNDGNVIRKRIEEGDAFAAFIQDVMCYQIAKEIGAGATVLEGKVDLIVLTGGLAHDSRVTGAIERRVRFIADVRAYPGEDEMEALAYGALRVLDKEAEAKTYGGH